MGYGTVRDVVTRHWQQVEDAIRTGDMKKVKTANRQGYDRERREVGNYGARRKR